MLDSPETPQTITIGEQVFPLRPLQVGAVRKGNLFIQIRRFLLEAKALQNKNWMPEEELFTGIVAIVQASIGSDVVTPPAFAALVDAETDILSVVWDLTYAATYVLSVSGFMPKGMSSPGEARSPSISSESPSTGSGPTSSAALDGPSPS